MTKKQTWVDYVSTTVTWLVILAIKLVFILTPVVVLVAVFIPSIPLASLLPRTPFELFITGFILGDYCDRMPPTHKEISGWFQ